MHTKTFQVILSRVFLALVAGFIFFFARSTAICPYTNPQKDTNITINPSTFSYINISSNAKIVIKYPSVKSTQIKPEILDKLNQAIFNIAVGTYENEDECIGLTLNYDYEITTMENSVIGICFSGMYFYKGSPHPSAICNTITIDTSTGDVLPLSHFISLSDLKEKSENSDFAIAVVKGTTDLLVNYSVKNLISKYLESAAFVNNYYIRGNKIGLVIGMMPAEGDFAIIEICRPQEILIGCEQSENNTGESQLVNW